MTLRKDSDHRRPEDRYFKEDHRGRGWKQHERIPDERVKEYQHPVRGEPRHSNRGCYEGKLYNVYILYVRMIFFLFAAYQVLITWY